MDENMHTVALPNVQIRFFNVNGLVLYLQKVEKLYIFIMQKNLFTFTMSNDNGDRLSLRCSKNDSRVSAVLVVKIFRELNHWTNFNAFNSK